MAEKGYCVKCKTKREMKEVKVRKERSHVEGRLRDTLDNLMEGCQIFGFDWKCLYVNDSALSQMGMVREEMFDRTLKDIYPGLDGTGLYAALDRCMKERNSQRVISEIALAQNSHDSFYLFLMPVLEGLMILSMKANVKIKERKIQ